MERGFKRKLRAVGVGRSPRFRSHRNKNWVRDSPSWGPGSLGILRIPPGLPFKAGQLLQKANQRPQETGRSAHKEFSSGREGEPRHPSSSDWKSRPSPGRHQRQFRLQRIRRRRRREGTGALESRAQRRVDVHKVSLSATDARARAKVPGDPVSAPAERPHPSAESR